MEDLENKSTTFPAVNVGTPITTSINELAQKNS